MSRDKRGFTLVEVIIAMLILTVGMLALLNTAAVVISNNLLNEIRDEAVRLGQETMDEKRNSPLSPSGWSCSPVQRNFKSVSLTYNVCSQVTALSSDGNTMQIDVAVGWDYKGTGSLAPTNKKYQHTASSVVRIGS